MNQSIAHVEKAYETLRSVGVTFEERDSVELFALPDLPALFRDCGATVEIEEPTLDDFNDANRRACLRLSPHPPKIKSDEMRDLVIWATAIRLSVRDQGAVLLSRDELHNHERGDDEALAAGLTRISSVDDMLEYLGVESSAGKLVRLLLEPIWTDLRAAGLPLQQDLVLRSVDNAVFRSGEAGIESVEFDFVTTSEDNGRLEAHVEITSTGDNVTEVNLNQIKVDQEPWQNGSLKIATDKPLPAITSESAERLEALREIIGDQS